MTTTNEEHPIKKNVYQLIAAVAGELALEGISKSQRNNQQGGGYNFRGIDDVYNAVGPIIAKHGLVILTRCLSRDVVERVSGKGTALFYVTVHAEFDFVSGDDGSKHTVSMFGEAMDSGDKATNKAISAAFKYALFQAFCIPTEAQDYADKSTYTVEPKQRPPYTAAQIEKNMPIWQKAINEGKSTPEKIVTMVSSAYTLSMEQVALIHTMRKQIAGVDAE